MYIVLLRILMQTFRQ